MYGEQKDQFLINEKQRQREKEVQTKAEVCKIQMQEELLNNKIKLII